MPKTNTPTANRETVADRARDMAARIEALREAVQQDRYPVDVPALADAILGEDLPTLFS